MSEAFTKKLLQPDKVSDLLAEHKAEVESTLQKAKEHVAANPELKEAADLAPLDELYVLRFVLTAKRGDPKIALENLIKTLEWRSQRLPDLKLAQEGKIKHQEIVTKHSKVGIVGLLNDLHPVFVIRGGRSSTKALFSELTVEQLIENKLLTNERIYHLCDKKTRETGLLCKQVVVVDLEGFSLFSYDSKWGKTQGKTSTMSAIYYPQLLGKTILCNMPVAFRLIFKAMSIFMPATTLEKMAVCPGNTLKHPVSDCPFMRKFSNGAAIMPPFLGGIAKLLPELTLEEKEK